MRRDLLVAIVLAACTKKAADNPDANVVAATVAADVAPSEAITPTPPAPSSSASTVSPSTVASGGSSRVDDFGISSDAIIGPTMASVAVPNGDRVIASLRPGFRSCHNKGLQSDPTMTGKIQISATVAPNGDVTRADATSTSVSAGVTTCVLQKVRLAAFDPPGGSGSTIQFPITFVVRK